jgi:hypothetical protein
MSSRRVCERTRFISILNLSGICPVYTEWLDPTPWYSSPFVRLYLNVSN